MTRQILIIAKENSMRINLGQHLRQEGFVIAEMDHADEAMAILGVLPVQVVLLGLDSLKRDGLALMRNIRNRFADIKIILINSGDQLELSIEGMRLGAYDDFIIPFDLDALIASIRKALGRKPS
ncbi:MAG: response regulator [Desulfobacteraceae bacterium]|nr:response regulator [Desulfobacteraceae bacterium]